MNQPALEYLLLRMATGQLDDGKHITDRFLREAPNAVHYYLLRLADEFFTARYRIQGLEVMPEFRALALLLTAGEVGREAWKEYSASADDELYLRAERLARLIFLEDRRRAGEYSLVAPYSLLKAQPSAAPLSADRRTQH